MMVPIKAPAENLKHCNNLHLISNDIGDEGAKALGENLKRSIQCVRALRYSQIDLRAPPILPSVMYY